MRVVPRSAIAAIGLAVTLEQSACGDADDGGVALVEGVRVEVDAVDNAFEPLAVEVVAGTEVVFVNRGRNDHNVVPVGDGQEAIRVDSDALGSGASAGRRLTEPGAYAYYCSIHGTTTNGMIGTIIVTEGDP